MITFNIDISQDSYRFEKAYQKEKRIADLMALCVMGLTYETYGKVSAKAPRASGLLASSISKDVVTLTEGDALIIRGTVQTNMPAFYAEYVHEGTGLIARHGAYRMKPPYSRIAYWTRVKLGIDDPRVVNAIRTKIFMRGTLPRPFFAETYREMQPRFLQVSSYLQHAVKIIAG